MDTKKAIEWLEGQKQKASEPVEPSRLGIDLLLNEVIELLQREEKFEAMWKLLEASMEGQYCITPMEVYFKKDTINQQMENIKQKYFPPNLDKVNKV